MTKNLNSSEAADYIKISLSWLAKSRLKGDGPPYAKIGRRVVYNREDLDQWLATRRRRSTSE